VFVDQQLEQYVFPINPLRQRGTKFMRVSVLHISIFFSKVLSAKGEGFCTAAYHLYSKRKWCKLTGLTEDGNELSGTV